MSNYYQQVDNDQEQSQSGELMMFPAKSARRYSVRLLEKFIHFSARWSDVVKGYVPCAPDWQEGQNKAKKFWVATALDLAKNEVRILQLDWGGYQHFTKLDDSEKKFTSNLTIDYKPGEAGAFGTYTLTWGEPSALTKEQQNVVNAKHITVQEYYDSRLKDDQNGVTRGTTASEEDPTDSFGKPSADVSSSDITNLNFE